MTPQTTWRHAAPFIFQEPTAHMPIIKRKPQNSIQQSLQLLADCMEQHPMLPQADIAEKLGWTIFKVKSVCRYQNGKAW
jgi:hypothetical protein